MFRSVFFLVILWPFYPSSSFAVVASENEIREQFSLAQNLAAKGQVEQAIKIYQSLINSHPNRPETYNNLAALYLQKNDTKKAKHILEQGLHAHKGYGVLYESLTAINVAMARKAYSKALQIDLKPSPISIASLSLANNKTQSTKNTITISKIDSSVLPVLIEPLLPKEKHSTKNQVIKKIAQANFVRKTNISRNAPTKEINTQPVEKVLHAWAAAWSAQAVDIYLSFYHNKYKPRNGMSQKNWIQSRKYRLTKPRWIKISLLDLKIIKQGKRQAVVNFKQVYKSNSFNDVSYKQIVLINTNGGWRIFRENNF